MFTFPFTLFSAQIFVNEFSMEFGGDNDYLEAASPSILDFERTDTFSACMWFKSENITADKYLISKMSATATAYPGWFVRTIAGELNMWMINDNAANNQLKVTGSTTLTTGVWYHLVMTTDGTGPAGIKFYLNSSLEGMTVDIDNLSGSIQNSVKFRIGARQLGGYYDGKMDEIQIYNRVLGQTEITRIYNSGVPIEAPSDGLLLDIGFTQSDIDSFPTMNDRSSSGYDMTAVGMSVGSIQGDTP